MEKTNKMPEDIFYMLRHLKTFKGLTGNDSSVWRVKWNNGESPMVYNMHNENIKFYVDDIQLAEYIASLHNYSAKLVKEVESKYV